MEVADRIDLSGRIGHRREDRFQVGQALHSGSHGGLSVAGGHRETAGRNRPQLLLALLSPLGRPLIGKGV